MDNEVSINIVSHNINGFSSSADFLKESCDENLNSIFCIQEHWLCPGYKRIKSINQLRTVHSSFDGYGSSAMSNVHSESIRKGRPYGGTGFVYSKKFAPFLKPLLQYESERITVMKLFDSEYPILILNVYFPFRQGGNDHRVEYLEVLGSLESIILANPDARFIIAGDFNYNIYDEGQVMSSTIVQFLDNHGLIPSHDLDPSFSRATSYTRCCHKTGSYSVLDYLFISRSLRNRIRNCGIVFDGRNPSDHFPVSLQLDLVPELSGDANCTSMNVNDGVCWSKVRDDVSENYRMTMEALLDSIDIPKGIVHGDRCCSCDLHVSQIGDYYRSVISVLELADSLLPRKSSYGKNGKDFWTRSLSNLKNNSVDAYNAWSRDGRPSSGQSFEHKKSCHYVYKAELRRQRRLFASEKVKPCQID